MNKTEEYTDKQTGKHKTIPAASLTSAPPGARGLSLRGRLRDAAVLVAGRLYNSNWFLSRSIDTRDRRLRENLLRQFRAVDRNLGSVHAEREMLIMTDFLLTTKVPGCIVECGCFKGGSSAKLSLVAAATGRKLYICDSFQGLPAIHEGDGDFSLTATGQAYGFHEGQYAASMDLVRNNITQWGNISVCTLVPGFFCDSLPGLKTEPAFIFADADLIQSTRDVLRHLWPALAVGGRFYSHDTNHTEFVEGIMDNGFWTREIGEPAPVMFGAGYGCGWGAPAIAFCIKNGLAGAPTAL